MLQDDLEIGKFYAYRMTAKHDDTDLVKVQVLSAGRKGKIRVRYEEGESTGLDEWVRTKQIACRWAQRRKWLRDHEHKLRLDQADAEAYDKVVYDAIDFVMEASGEYTGYMLGEARIPRSPSGSGLAPGSTVSHSTRTLSTTSIASGPGTCPSGPWRQPASPSQQPNRKQSSCICASGRTSSRRRASSRAGG